MERDSTAIVTGAGKRVGRAVAEALIADGWNVIAHVHHDDDPVPPGAIRAVAELGDPECAERIFAVAEGRSPIRLLVNSAARFAYDGFGGFDLAEFDAHMAVNLRAPILLSEVFAARHSEGDAMIVNIVDAKVAAPNSDFLSYTLSKQALADFSQLAARAYAGKGIRVNAIAPALMLRSAGQTEANFAASHALNPLGRGVVPDDVASAIRYLVEARTVTGQLIVVDGGQQFMALERDVQFLVSKDDA